MKCAKGYRALGYVLSTLFVFFALCSCGTRGNPYTSPLLPPPPDPPPPVITPDISLTVTDENGTTITSTDGSYSFGLVPANFDFGAKTFTLTNAGTTAATISSTTLSGADTTQFSVASEPGATLAAGGSSTFGLEFLPTAAGTKSATISIASDDETNPSYQFSITGATTWGTGFLDGNVLSVGLNRNSARAATFPEPIVLNGKIYLFWDESTAGPSQIRARVYNGDDSSPSWAFIDGNALAVGLNKDSSFNANFPQPAVLNSKLYVSWAELNGGGVSQIRVAVYNGNDSSPSFSFVDGNGANGINLDPTKSAQYPHLVAANSKLYITWWEQDGIGNKQVRAAVYNGNDSAPSWSFVDGGAATGLNIDVTHDVHLPKMVAFSSKLYIVWEETNGSAQQVRAKVYNGNDAAPSWTLLDPGGAIGLNRDTTYTASHVIPIVYNSKLYLVWDEVNAAGDTQIRVVVYNGNDGAPSWSFVDGGGVTGINKDTSLSAEWPKAHVFRGRLYFTWQETNGAIVQVRVACYNGDDSSPSVGLVDGSAASGLNRNPARSVGNPGLISLTDRLYATWFENEGTNTFQIRFSGANQ
jgi:hypothetical protein